MRKLWWIAPVLLCTGTADAGRDDPVRWAWECGSSAFYEMKVLPDGHYRAITDRSAAPVTVTVKTDARSLGSCSTAPYYVEIQPSGSLFSTAEFSEPCLQIVIPELRWVPDKNAQLERLKASIGGRALISLDIAREDAEWRFVLSRTDITTERHARELRVSPVTHNMEWRAETSMSFYTGECILKK
jgi:hypothetical protein